jgi:Domain of unknown function (DUF1413)
MKLIKTVIDDETYAILVRKRKKEGVPSVSALFLKQCGVLTDEKGASEIVKRALRIAKGRESGFEFRLRDLFPAKQWGSWPKGTRLRAGRLFHEEIAAAIHGVRASRKSGSGHQRYMVA